MHPSSDCTGLLRSLGNRLVVMNFLPSKHNNHNLLRVFPCLCQNSTKQRENASRCSSPGVCNQIFNYTSEKKNVILPFPPDAFRADSDLIRLVAGCRKGIKNGFDNQSDKARCLVSLCGFWGVWREVIKSVSEMIYCCCCTTEIWLCCTVATINVLIVERSNKEGIVKQAIKTVSLIIQLK